MLVWLIKHYLAVRKEALETTKDNPIDNEEAIELIVMSTVALVVVTFVYFTELKSHLNSFYQ